MLIHRLRSEYVSHLDRDVLEDTNHVSAGFLRFVGAFQRVVMGAGLRTALWRVGVVRC